MNLAACRIRSAYKKNIFLYASNQLENEKFKVPLKIAKHKIFRNKFNKMYVKFVY